MPKVGRRSDQLRPDYLDSSRGVVQKNAPFGTNYTPTVRVKIIGGKPVTVIEPGRREDPRQDELASPRRGDTTSRKSPVLAPLTEKPNHIDPTHFNRNTTWGFSSAQQDSFNSQIHGMPTKYSIVPPIGYGKNVDGVKMERPPTNPEGPGIMNQQQTTILPEFREDDIYRPLPVNRVLPDQPITLSKEDELSLMRSVYRNMRGTEFSKLKDIYTELTGYDSNLTGYILFRDLSYTFLKNQVNIPPQTLRLIAAMSASETEQGKVNYENILKFLGAAMKDPMDHSHHPTKGPESPRRGQVPSEPARSPRSLPVSLSPPPFEQQSTYYNPILQKGERYKKRKLQNDMNSPKNSKLLKMLTEAIQDPVVDIDLEKIHESFRQADRDYRGTLSADQIKELAIFNRLPLQDSLIDQILSVFVAHNGQINWLSFMGYLEKVVPAHTGLNIPRSKRPLEYAKQFPTPGMNWPKYETPRDTPLPSDARYTPRNMNQGSFQRAAPLPDIYKHSTGEPSEPPYDEIHPNSYLEPPRHPRDDDLDRIQENLDRNKRIHKLEQDLKDLESTFEESRKQRVTEKQDHESEPWFDRFKKLADAMYSNDSANTGFLNLEDVERLLQVYNDTYNLKFSNSDLNKYIGTYCPDGKKVHIHGLLTALLSVSGDKR